MKNNSIKRVKFALPLTFILSALGLYACQPSQETMNAPQKTQNVQMATPLEQTHWIFNSSKKTNDPAYFVLRSKENRITGYSGCNRFFGQYRHNSKETIIDIQNLASTLMACPNSVINEYEFLQNLEKADRYNIKGNTLTLMDRQGKTLASFTAKNQTKKHQTNLNIFN